MTLRRDQLNHEEALMGNPTKQAVAVEGELRRIAVSHIRVVDGFNPRRERDANRFAELVATVREDGVLEPVLVTPNEDGDYDLVAGKGRFLAAVDAGCTEVPATVRSIDRESGGLELAMIENLVREELSPVDEAYGYQRLIDAGLTRKGVAEKVRRSFWHAPRPTWPKLDAGSISCGSRTPITVTGDGDPRARDRAQVRIPREARAAASDAQGQAGG
jgi:ParB/RepB/Spo0J family partition protein